MAKIYTKGTWVDEVLADVEKYRVLNDSDVEVYAEATIQLATGVVTPGTALTAARMNNIENGIDAIDDLLDTVNGLVQSTGVTKVRETGGPTTLAVGAVPDSSFLKRSGSGLVGRAIADVVTDLKSGMKTALVLDTLQLLVSPGNLITDGASGYCDAGEMVRAPINLSMFRVNKFEKGEIGYAELPFIPTGWNLGTVTAKIKHSDIGGNVINSCAVAWDASQGANSVITALNGTTLAGNPTVTKCALNASATTGLVMTDVITSMNLQGAKFVSFYILSTVALNANDFSLCVDDTASCASILKEWNLPAIAASTWTKVSLACGDMSAAGLAAVISVGLKQLVDKGALDIYIWNVCWQGTVTWQIQAVCLSSGDSLDVAQGTVQEISGDVKFYEDQVLTFPTLTVGGTPTAGDRILIAVSRKNNASDTHGAGKACFGGVELSLTRA